MSEAALIPKIPPIERPDPKVVEAFAPPGNDLSPASTVESGKVNLVSEPTVPDEVPVIPDEVPIVSDEVPAVSSKGSTITDADVAISTGSTVIPDNAESSDEYNDSITLFQGITYASFVLTFCLAGFAAVVVFRKALKVSVKRFSIGAKVLSLAYLMIAFIGSFGTYIYSRFLYGDDTSFALIIPIMQWILVGPATALVLNSLLTREDKPDAKKILFDVFTYVFIFSCVVASQIPSLGAEESIVFSFLGTVLFIAPVVRFSTSLKVAKVFHPELQEMFVQILIRSLLFLPLLLPSLAFVNVCGLIGDDLALLLFNLITLVFVLMTGLLMVISIDYITQGISADQLVSNKVNAPIAPSDPKPNKPVVPVSPVSPVALAAEETPKPVPKQPAKTETKSPASPVKPDAPKSSPSSEKPSIPFEESLETFEFDVEKHNSTVIDFDTAKSSTGKSQEDISSSEKSNRGPSGSKSRSGKKPKNTQVPKAPQQPNKSKTSDSKSRIKPPEKPKKRF